jgi:ABC-type molybdate transport system substrate-binding protein
MKKYAYLMLISFYLLGFSFAWSQEKPSPPATVITVAAASDLKFALTEIAASYEKNSGQKINLLFGSTGSLSTQLLQNAPFDIFMSADESLVFKLADAGKEVGKFKAKHDDMFNSVSSLNARIEELEQHKLHLLEKLKSYGDRGDLSYIVKT